MVKRKQLKPAEACEGLEFVKLGDLVSYLFYV